MKVTAGQRVVVVVAHPDDESFPCGSLIARSVAAGAHVTVLCATRGEEGERVPDAATDHLPLAEVREAELHAAAALLGVASVELLGFADSGFDGPVADGSLCAQSIDSLSALLVARLKHLDAEHVVTFDGSDGHRDHLHLRAAIEAAVQSSPAALTMASLPNSLMRRWVSEMQVMQPDTVYLDIDLDALGAPDDELTAIDAAEFFELRLRAIATHRSQRSPYDGLSPDLQRAFLAVDHVRN